jgi:hypothetical protein
MKPLRTRLRVPSILLSLVCVIVLVTAGMIVFNQPGIGRASSTLSFTPVADSYVNQIDPNANFGTNRSIRADGSPQVHSYLRFEVTGVNNNPVVKVTLRIYANSASSRGFDVYKVSNNSWQEKEITYSNAPEYGNKVGTSDKFPANHWVEVDVSSLLTGDGTVSIALTGINQTAINMTSRDDNSNKPELLVEVSSENVPIPTDTTTPEPTAANPSEPTATNPPAPTDSNPLIPTETATNPPLPTETGTTPTDPTVTNTPLPSATATTPPDPTASAPVNDKQPGFPIRAVFAYPWFPEAWNQQGFNPFTNYTPSLGFYDSGSVTVIQNHISAMTYGNLNAAILSWWGQGSRTDQRVATILGATPGSSNPDFRWSLYFENESQADPAIEQIQGDLQYIQSHYGNDPSFLRVNGKFVVFVYADALDSCGMADRWVQANNSLGHPAYIVLKVFSGYRNCTSQPDSWHQYAPAVATDEQKGYSYAISPGFWKKGDTNPRLARDMTTWSSIVKSMIGSGEPWQLVTTFNEWGEGTSVESAVEWASPSGFGQYLDVLHDNGNNTPSQPTSTSQLPSTTQPITTPGPTTPPTQTQTPPPNPTVTPTGQPSATPPQVPGNDPILFYTSDLVSGSSVDRGQAVVSLILNLMAQHPGTQMLVASGGDNEQENSPTISNYQSYFGTTYGTFVQQGIFMQVRGNHDIQSQGSYTDFNGNVHNTGAAYWDYFGPDAHMQNIEGQKLTDYSYNLGNWHIIALDQLNGSVNNATLHFLTADLAANADKTCQLVYWHVPTYSSGAAHGDSTGLKPLNQAEFNAGVDIQLNGHDHDYQRFYPINPNGVRDDANGITTFVAGIGGQNSRSGSQTSIAQAASATYLDTFPGNGGHAIGVIQFVLHTNSADYTLYNANDGSILDQGTVVCH